MNLRSVSLVLPLLAFVAACAATAPEGSGPVELAVETDTATPAGLLTYVTIDGLKPVGVSPRDCRDHGGTVSTSDPELVRECRRSGYDGRYCTGYCSFGTIDSPDLGTVTCTPATVCIK